MSTSERDWSHFINHSNGFTYVSSDLINELWTRIKALEYRVAKQDQEINSLDYIVNGEDFEGIGKQMELNFDEYT